MGLHSYRRVQLATADDDVPHAGLPTLWAESGRASSDECAAAHRLSDCAVSGPAANDGIVVAGRVRGGGICDSSAARGIRGLGGGTQGRAERPVLHADPLGVHTIRPEADAKREPGAGPGRLVPKLRLLSGAVALFVGLDVQADAGDVALCPAAAGPLAAAAGMQPRRSRELAGEPFVRGEASPARSGGRIVRGDNSRPARGDSVVRRTCSAVARGQRLDLLCGLSEANVVAVGPGRPIPVGVHRG